MRNGNITWKVSFQIKAIFVWAAGSVRYPVPACVMNMVHRATIKSYTGYMTPWI